MKKKGRVKVVYTIYCILIYTALLGGCFFFSVPIASLIERRLRKRERERHRKQAEQDMHNMNAVYNDLMLKQAVGGDMDE